MAWLVDQREGAIDPQVLAVMEMVRCCSPQMVSLAGSFLKIQFGWRAHTLGIALVDGMPIIRKR